MATIRFQPEDYSDAGNAELFVLKHKNDLLYTVSGGFYYWTGKRWEQDDHKPTSLALEMTKDMLKEARSFYRETETSISQSNDDSEKAKLETELKKDELYLKHAQKSRDARPVWAIVTLSQPGLKRRADDLDANPFDLNTPAGIVDLNTGEIRDHDASAYCTKMTTVSPCDDGAEMWREFLDTVTQGDTELLDFLQRVVGMMLIGAVFDEYIILPYGNGCNGKSTFLNVLVEILGDYAASFPSDMFTTKPRGNTLAIAAELKGRRMVLGGELENGDNLDASQVKKYCSRDKIYAQKKYKEGEEFIPTHTMVIHTNHLPDVKSMDDGTWRRLLPIPFNAKIENADTGYGKKLVVEAGGAILKWAVEGAVAFRHDKCKLMIPKAVSRTRDRYRAREDWFMDFLQEECDVDHNYDTKEGGRELYIRYKMWAKEAGLSPLSRNKLYARLRQEGFEECKPGNITHFRGIYLKPRKPNLIRLVKDENKLTS